MKTHLSPHIQTSRRLKWISAGAACLLAALLASVCGVRYISNACLPTGGYHTRLEISRKALRIAPRWKARRN